MAVIAQSADGVQHQFPDGTNPAVIDGVMKQYAASAQSQKQLGAPSNGPQTPASGKVDEDGNISAQSYATDMAKSLGAGVVKGAENLAGSLGDVSALNSSLLSKGVAALGGGQTAQDVAGMAGKALLGPAGMVAPTTQQVQQVTSPVTAPADNFQPQTTPGQYAQTVGEFLPNAALGEGGLIKRAAQTVIPAVTSEAAGQLAQKYAPSLEPYAKLAGAIGGGVATAIPDAISAEMAAKNVLNSAPTHDAVSAATDAMYNQLRNAGVKYDANGYQQAIGDLANSLDHAGMIPELAPMSSGIMKLLNKGVGQSPDFNDVENARRLASGILGEGSATKMEKGFAGQIADSLDKYVGSAAYSHDGTVPDVSGLVTQARQMARTNIVANQVEDMISKAQSYQSGFQSGLQNQFSNYLRSAKAQGLSDAEKAAFQDVATGNLTRNALTILGKFGIDPSALGNKAAALPALLATGATHFGGSMLDGGASLVASSAAKYAGRKMTEASANNALKTVLLGKQGQAQLSAVRGAAPAFAQPQAVNALTAFGNMGQISPQNSLAQFLRPAPAQ